MSPARWNWSRHARGFREADGLVVSVPKSGRTWLRVLLQAYVTGATEESFQLEGRQTGFPRVAFCHDRWEHRTSPRLGRRLVGRYLIPRDAVDKPLALLARDPRDVVVSLHHQLHRREKRFTGTLGELLVDPLFGVEAIVATMNGWRDEWQGRPGFRIFRYEDLRAETHKGFAALLEHLGFAPLDPVRLEAAVAFSAFESMKKREQRDFFGKDWLTPGDRSDPDSFKVRRGKVGGFADELSDEESAVATRAARGLHPDFGYRLD